MPLEIERKFLLRDAHWRDGITSTLTLCQGYLCADGVRTVRVRTMRSPEGSPRGFITVKAARAGASRPEFEYEIPFEDAARMLDTLCGDSVINKHRHLVPYAGHIWEVDEFFGANAGLVMAELELRHEDEPFAHPQWLGAEVTHDLRYYNSQLIKQPFSTWPQNTTL